MQHAPLRISGKLVVYIFNRVVYLFRGVFLGVFAHEILEHFYQFNWRMASSFMISSAPPPMHITFTSL